jgi:hypothetical protein
VLGAEKPICTAPASSPVSWAPYTLAFWENFLARAGIDDLMIQDGVGAERNNVTTDLPSEYGIISTACEAEHVAFWTDLEIFEMPSFIPAPISRVQAQLALECKYVLKIVVFDVPHYLSLQYSPEAAVLFTAYNDSII